jgi:hypothetical protein
MLLFLFETKIIAVIHDHIPYARITPALQAELSPIFHFRTALNVRNATTALQKRKRLRILGGKARQCGIWQPQARALSSSSRHSARN